MRAIILAAGLCAAATTAMAGTQNDVVTRSGSNLALANGCVYAPTAQGNQWSFLFRQSGAKVNCALTLTTQAQRPAAVQIKAGSRGKLNQEFIVGAFR
ncbi:MAG: hypothetical protein ABJR46_14415 [Tateyamaria sp.]|uniref:hypothetical protein n=1 Tax=Tateyamaria sp. TaxID=1929288 RepID=UPI003287C434